MIATHLCPLADVPPIVPIIGGGVIGGGLLLVAGVMWVGVRLARKQMGKGKK